MVSKKKEPDPKKRTEPEVDKETLKDLDVTDAQTAPLIDRDFQDARVEVFSSDKIVDGVGEVIESKRWFEPHEIPS